jgi:hypothetical protein
MKPQYHDESFSLGMQQSTGSAICGGADLGQILVSGRASIGRDEAGRHRAGTDCRRTVAHRSRRRDDDHGCQAVA